MDANTEDNLKNWTLDIVNSINARDLLTPVGRYASPDYTYENTEDNGSVLKVNTSDMLRLREMYFTKLSPDVFAEVKSTEVHVDPHSRHATVWVGMVVRNDARGVVRERMNIFYWRLEEQEVGRDKWVWWKEHTSAGFAPQVGDV